MSRFQVRSAHGDFGHRLRAVWSGYHKHRALLDVPESPHLERLANPRVQVGLLPSPQGCFTLADAHAIKVGRFPTS